MLASLARVTALCDGAADPPFGRLVRGPGVAGAPEAARAAGLPAAVLPGVLAYADDWEGAHEAAQGDPSALGNWWHAILHRREPDADNAMYWYRRVRLPGPVGAALGREVAVAWRTAGLPGADALRDDAPFDPAPFVAACEDARAGRLDARAVAALVAIQRLEWRAAIRWAGVALP